MSMCTITSFFTNKQTVTPELLAWPPLRIYSKADKSQLLPVADLVCLESDRNYTWLQWTNGQRLMAPYTLKRFQGLLPASWFVRLNRHTIVNCRFVERVEDNPEGPKLYLTNGRSFTVSRRQWVELRKWFT